MNFDLLPFPADLPDHFAARFSAVPTLIASAPGRVNLIGEHTDYNEGFVLPVAIDRRTWVALSPSDDGRFHFASLEIQGDADLSKEELESHRGKGWSSYVAGVTALLHAAGIPLGGANCLVTSTVPQGSGLSSSAALEVSVAVGLTALAGRSLSTLETIRLAQRAEWDWAGVHCGIMDQFIATVGKTSTALFLDCRTLTYERVPLDPTLQIVVCDTHVPRTLAGSAYNRRLEECGAAVRTFAGFLPEVRSLRDVTPDAFARHAPDLEEIPRRRARHVVSEDQRVLDAVDVLWQRDHAALGRLLNASHESLRIDYEVSCPELDVMAEICRSVPGVYGARMTGAGFGGCVLALATQDAVQPLTVAVEHDYPVRTGHRATVIACQAGEGARVIRLR